MKEVLDTVDSAQPGRLRPNPPRFPILIHNAMKIGVEVGTLATNCLRFISTLTSHVDGLTKLLAELPDEDHTNAVSLGCCLVMSLTALAEILDLMSRVSPEPLATDYQRRCIVVLMRAVEVVHGLGQDDFLIIGLFLAVCYREPG